MQTTSGVPRPLLVVSCLLATGLTSCSGWTLREPAHPPGYPIGYVERGTASWYGPGFHGNRTANGEIYDMHKLTAAHRTLPLGSIAEVTSLTTGRTVMVRINDRGPFVYGRVLDLSLAGARALGIVHQGTDEIQLKVVDFKGRGIPSGAYRLQVASFEELGNAQAFVERLNTGYPDTKIVMAELPEGTRYRVLAGRYQTERQAEAAAYRLRQWLGGNPLVIRAE